MNRPHTAVLSPHLIARLPARFRRGKRPYVFLVTLLVITHLLAFAVFNPYPYGPQLFVAMAAFLALLLLAVHKGMGLPSAIHIGTATGALFLTYVIWHSGGVFSPRMGWLMLLPLTPYYVISPRSGMIWMALAFGFQVTLAGLSYVGLLRPFEPGEQGLLMSWVTFSVLTSVLLIVPLLYDRLYRQAMRQSRQRQRELEQQRQELERTLQTRELFMATVSHELRTPMNAILGFNALLMSRVQNKPEAFKVLQHTSQSAEHLMTVINDILDYSQLQAGKLEIHAEPIDLRSVAQHAFEMFLPRVQDTTLSYRIELDPQLPDWVYTDRHRLMQVLVNLLGNALKFTHQGEVLMTVQWLHPGVLFAVRDTGIGIAKEQQSHIFSRFVQADKGIHSRYGGNGLGLAISRQLVGLLGGEMGFESERGTGSRFWLRLPLSACPAPTRRPSARPEVQTADFAWRFLVVDDHAINRLLAKQVLRAAWAKAEIVEAADGKQALDCLRDGTYDLVLMDMVMPVMDGIVATRTLRSTLPEPTCRVPVLGLTANVNPADLEAFQRAGLCGLMLKPFEPALLCARIEQLLLQRGG